MYSCFMYLPGSHSQFNALLAGVGGGCNPNNLKIHVNFRMLLAGQSDDYIEC